MALRNTSYRHKFIPAEHFNTTISQKEKKGDFIIQDASEEAM